jgi:hypothetical protein
MLYQSWNKLMDYIQIQFATEFNQLEINIPTIRKIIETVSLPDISHYNGRVDWIYVDEGDYKSADPYGTERIYTLDYTDENGDPKPISYIEEIVYTGRYYDANNYYPYYMQGQTPLDVMFDQKSYQMKQSVLPHKTWTFRQPNELVVMNNNIYFSGMKIKIKIPHESPETIDRDIYKYFLKKCEVDVIDYIISIRSKFTALQTPQGEINLNIDHLREKRERLEREYMQFMDSLPPEIYIYKG